MSKLTDIKYQIDQLDGGSFQNLCDKYLSCKGYGVGYSFGMKTGTNKTAKGNPDTYFLTQDGKYVFVMYTTQKDNFVKKALEDLEKCFDLSKTGLPSEDIAEIVYCHTCGRISPGDSQLLHKYCEERNTVLSLIGLDDLGNDLYQNYPGIAKDFLNISIDTGQITSLSEFMQTHDANKMSAPLQTEFMLREEELKSAKEKLNLSDVLVLSGPAGVGKTRLALQLCEEIAAESEYEILCIKSNGLELYDDLITALETGKNYLIFVDDANELTGLHFVLELLPKSAIGRKCIKKVVITVRDYARQQVVKQILEVEKPEILKVGSLKDGEIRKLVETIFGITNHVYLDRIVSIAEGNARLAMLAGKVAAQTGCIDSIRDATELYEHYYGKQIEAIMSSETGIASAGIMAFLQALRLDNLERLKPIFDAINLTERQFISDLRQFHTQELLDLCHDKAAKISDQSFSNYLIKYVFVDQKIIPLSEMIKNCFFLNQEKTISACNILLKVFSDKDVQDYVNEQVKIVWDCLRSDTESFFPFFKAFCMVRPTETLVFINDLIELESPHKFNVRSIAFKKTESEKSISDDIIGILCRFRTHSQLPEAIELLLLYYQKRPDLFEQVYSAFISRFGVDKDASRYGYFTQKTAVEQLCVAVESNPTDEILLLFVRVAEDYLKLSFSRVEGGRQHTFTFYTMPLMLHDAVLEYREMLLQQVYKIYISGECREDIESLLMDYCTGHEENENYQIIKHELDLILSFFALFSPEKLYHCVIAEHINEIAKYAEYDCGNALEPFLNSHKYQIYNALNTNHGVMLQLGYQEYNMWHKKQVQNMVREYRSREFQYLFQVCKECIETIDRDECRLSFGVEYAIDTFSKNQELYINVVNEYLNADTPYNIRASWVLHNLFKMMPAEEVKKFIESHTFSQKNTWLWFFYVELPTEQISADWANDFLKYLESDPQHIRSSPYRPLDEIEKFECVDRDMILKASRVILSLYKESPFVISLYFYHMMNSYHAEVCEIIDKYKGSFPTNS
jgi:DNA polymerase III delta prime subunit